MELSFNVNTIFLYSLFKKLIINLQPLIPRVSILVEKHYKVAYSDAWVYYQHQRTVLITMEKQTKFEQH